ncbi:SRPBCC family protein [Solwaraspora sp. WMMA2065]|uniref:type II toxin-antitoxin system RatA family toxin n=1 Tax=Solwaraspora sp. WMMA2065 TaxID=3015166 RepID=UPI00259BCB51|nr:SRPBCC family protein [Solwaraspora sp. WMMA2065]WJK37399.1 SRPBCC family protein [Solwaraspora sp. WMMA2065]
MREVELSAFIPRVSPETVFDGVVRFERYPELAPHVESTVVHQTLPELTGSSSWELHFRSGLLRWTEEECFRRDELIVDFAQTDGDFDVFNGRWTFDHVADGCQLQFSAEFDFGIPSLEGILDPIAERVIRETVAWVVVGMFDEVRLGGGLEVPGLRPTSVAST